MKSRRKEWVVYRTRKQREEQLVRALDIHPLTARILLRRGFSDVDRAQRFLHPRLDEMHNPFLMKGMDDAVCQVLTSIDRGEKILVYGDYDVDGVSSVALVYEFLSQLGARVDYHVPLRDQEGYGLHVDTVRRAADDGCSLIITTDCGISNVEEIALAKKLGLRVVVIDHHTIPDTLPPADAILNPLQRDCDFPFEKLAAVGVAFHLLVGLRQKLREHGVFEHIPEPDLRNFLDLVALGTVADVVPLIDVNRTFVRHGLDVLASRRRPGVSALMERARVGEKQVTPQTISFRLAPRLNAAGRMGDASMCVELLTTDSYGRAIEVARRLEDLNDRRQDCEKEILEKVLPHARRQAEAGRKMLVIAGRKWHRGVLGIVASRLVEQYHRPVVLVGIDEHGLGKGSVRSVNGIDVINILDAGSELLETYGGHVAAAGLSVQEQYIDELRDRLDEKLTSVLDTRGLPRPRLRIDCEVELDELDVRFGRDLSRLGPFGTGNREPVLLCRESKASRVRVVGNDHLKAKFRDGSGSLEGIGFSMADERPVLDQRVSVAFVPRFATFRGRTRLEMHIRGLRPAKEHCPDRVEQL